MSASAAADDSPLLSWAFWAVLLAYGALALLTATGEHRWGDDWAQYVLHSRNLVDGHSYSDTGYVFNPDLPTIGPVNYPPGLPLLLAPLVAVFGINLAVLKAVGIACMVLALPVALRLFQPAFGRNVALVSVLLVAIHPAFWQLHQVIESEAPYILFSLLSLWWCARETPEPATPRDALLAGVLLGVLVYASVVFRSVGIALLPAMVVVGWARRKHWSWFAGLAFAFLLLLWLQSTWLVTPTTYQRQIAAPGPSGGGGPGWRGYVVALADLFPLPFRLSQEGAVLLILAALAGAWFASQPRAGQPARGLRAMAARVPVYVWYLGAYFSGLLVASISTDSRLLVPTLPILVPLIVYGAHRILLRLAPRRSRMLSIGAAVVATAYLVALQASGRFAPVEQMATCKDCSEMFAYLRDHTPADSVIVFNKPRALALLGSRRSWAPSFFYTPAALDQRMKSLHADYIVDGVPGGDFARRFPSPPALTARIHAPGAEELFRNANFVVVRPGPT